MQNKNNQDEARLHIRLNLSKERESQIHDFLSSLPSRTKSSFIVDAIYSAMQQNDIQDRIQVTIRETIQECLSATNMVNITEEQTEQPEKKTEVTKQEEETETSIDENVLADMSNFFD